MAKKDMLKFPDLSKVEEGGGSFHIPEGEYEMRVVDVVPAKSKSSDNDMFKWTFVGLDGRAKNKKFFLYTAVTDESLWKLVETLKALDVEIPDSAFEVDRNELIDRECIGTVQDNEYNNRINSKLVAIAAADGGGDKPAATKGAKASAGNGKSKKVTKYEQSDVEDMTEDELQDLIEKTGIDVDLSAHKTPVRKAKAVVAGLEAEGLIA